MWLRRPLRADGLLLVLASVAVVLVLQVCALPRKMHADAAIVAAAASLLEHGVHADRYAPGSAAAPEAGRAIPPGYPAIIAALAVIDARLGAGLRCLGTGRSDCFADNPLRALLALQTLAGVIALCLACFLARELSGSAEIAGLATVLMFLIGGFAEFAGLMQPILIVTALALACLALLVLAHRRRSVLAAAASGLVLGALALIEVYHAALVALVPLLLIGAERRRSRPDRRFARSAAAAFVAAAGLMLTPWMVRNHLLFGDVAIASGLPAKHLAERAAYNAVSAAELLWGVLCWLPGLGDLTALVVPAETRRKFDLYYEGSLLWEGGRILAAAGAASGSLEQVSRLVTIHVLGDPIGYAASSVLLVLRGLRSTGGLLVLWGLLALPLLLRRLEAHRGLGPFLLVAGPLVGLTLVQALLTANLPWMNVSLAFVYAYAVAEVTGGLELPIALRRLLATQRAAIARADLPTPAAADGLPAPARVRA